jgi:hypothetical protein
MVRSYPNRLLNAMNLVCAEWLDESSYPATERTVKLTSLMPSYHPLSQTKSRYIFEFAYFQSLTS